VSDSPLIESSTKSTNHVMARHASRFVDHDEAVCDGGLARHAVDSADV